MALWLRLYADVLDNPKIQRLPAPQFKFWINLIALAKLHDGILPPVEDVAFRLRLSGEEAQQHLSALVKAELLDFGEDGTMKPHDWEEHQYDSDSSKERTRKYRDKKKNVTTPSQGSHSDLLEQSRERADTEQSRERAETPAAHPLSGTPIPAKSVVEMVRRSLPQIPPDAERRVRLLADTAPNPQDYEPGVHATMQEIISSANPGITLAAMEDNIPAWWEAMRAGQVKVKILRYVIQDRDYLRKPREPTTKTRHQTPQEARIQRLLET